MTLTNLDPTALNTRYYSLFVTDSQPSSNQAQYRKNIKRTAAEYFQLLQQSQILARPDTPPIEVSAVPTTIDRNLSDLNKQATFLSATFVIGVIATVAFGLTGGIPLFIASAITTVTLVHILLARIAYNAYQQDQRDIPK